MFKKINNNKGATSFIIVIIVLVMIVLFAFAFDFFDIIKKRQSFNRHMNHIARTIGRQGGIKTRNPNDKVNGGSNWVANDDYWTSGEMIRQTEEILEAANINRNQWKIYISKPGPKNNYCDINNAIEVRSNTNVEYDFGDDICIFGVVGYRWGRLSSAMPNVKENRAYVYKRKVVSETWKRDDDIIIEDLN